MFSLNIFILLGLVAIFLNSCIIFLHFHPNKTSRNSYDRLILIFAVLDIVFAVLHSILLPVFVYQENTAAFLSVGLFCCFNFSQVLLNLLFIVYLSFIVLVTHSFVYRFAYFCKTELLHQLQRSEYELFMTICPLLIASPFMLVGNLKFGPKQELSALVENSLIEYDVNIFTAAYFAKVVGSGDSIYGVIIFVELLVLSGVVIATCAGCTLLITRKLNKQILSHRARRLHRRMLKLLVSQSVLPLVTLYVPVIFFILSVFFSIPVCSNTSFILALLLSFFPSLDAILVSIFVRDYRPFSRKEPPRLDKSFAGVVSAAMAARRLSMQMAKFWHRDLTVERLKFESRDRERLGEVSSLPAVMDGTLGKDSVRKGPD